MIYTVNIDKKNLIYGINMRTGKLINQLSGDVKYEAFLPNKLPFSIKMDDSLQSLLSEADIALGRLDGVADILPDIDFFLLMYVRKEATLSSQIEGTQATFIDVLKAEAKIEDVETRKDVDEILNYINAMNYGLKKVKTFPLSSRLIKEIHKILLHGVRGKLKLPGEFRKSQNWIGGSSINNATFVPPPHFEIDNLMSNLEKYLHDTSPFPVLLKTGLMHAQFETIHPFLDGNGRAGRLLMTFYLCHKKILNRPLLYLSDYFNRHRQVYYDKLNAIREKDDIEGWLRFFLEGVTETSKQALSTAKKIIKIREKHKDVVIDMGRAAINGNILLNKLYRSPMVRIKDVEKLTGLSNPNAIILVKKFEEAGLLKEITKRQRNRIYIYNEYVNLFSRSIYK